MLQTVKSLRFHYLQRCQTALKIVTTAPFPPFSVPSDTVSDGETVSFLPSGAPMGRALSAVRSEIGSDKLWEVSISLVGMR